MPETTDPTFYRSPAAAIAAPPESLAYVAAFDPAGEKRDAERDAAAGLLDAQGIGSLRSLHHVCWLSMRQGSPARELSESARVQPAAPSTSGPPDSTALETAKQ